MTHVTAAEQVYWTDRRFSWPTNPGQETIPSGSVALRLTLPLLSPGLASGPGAASCRRHDGAEPRAWWTPRCRSGGWPSPPRPPQACSCPVAQGLPGSGSPAFRARTPACDLGPISPVTWARLGVRSGSQRSLYDLVPSYTLTPVSATCRLQNMGQAANLSEPFLTRENADAPRAELPGGAGEVTCAKHSRRRRGPRSPCTDLLVSM